MNVHVTTSYVLEVYLKKHEFEAFTDALRMVVDVARDSANKYLVYTHNSDTHRAVELVSDFYKHIVEEALI